MRTGIPIGGWIALAALALTAPALVLALSAAEPRVVIVRRAPIRAEPRLSSAPIGSLRSGDRVTVLGGRCSWLRVQAGVVEGWMVRSQVSPAQEAPRPAGHGVQAATRGATIKPARPARHRHDRYEALDRLRPDLAAGFKLHDRISMERPVDDLEVVEFRLAGCLEPAEGEQ